MANMTINGATQHTEIQGTETLPASVGGEPRKIELSDIRDFVLSAIINAADASLGNVAMFLGCDDVEQPCRISIVDFMEAILDNFFNYENGNVSSQSVFTFKDGTDIKTIQLNNLVQAIDALLAPATAVNVVGLNNATTLADSNLVLLDQSGNVKATLGTLKSFVLAGLSAYIGGLSSGSPSGNSQIVIRNGTTVYKISLSDIASLFGDVHGPSVTTEHGIPQWDSASKTLKNGLSLATAVNAQTASGSSVPTTGAVKSAIDDALSSQMTLNGDQNISGVKTFADSPIVPTVTNDLDETDTDDDTGKAASTAWVTDKLAAWWPAIKQAAQTISGVWAFTSSPTVPQPTSNGQVANKAYVDDAVAERTLNWPVSTKTFSSNAATLDDRTVNVMSIAVGDTCTVTVPSAKSGYSRAFCLVLSVTGSSAGSATLNLSGGTFAGDAADTFTIAPGKTHVITFVENGASTDHFFVSRRTYETVGTAFVGTIE